MVIYEGTGCEECAQTGYRGRSGIYEFLPVTDAIRQLILKRSSADLIRDAAVKQGMRTLREDGWRTVREGVTTVGEVVRVTQEEV
jgi:type II secretory ATPase GspE/PulE/Tfp pilus assembly ATPase PilB-like protein